MSRKVLVTTLLVMLAVSALFGGIAAVRGDQRFLIPAGILLLMAGGMLLDSGQLLVKSGEVSKTQPMNITFQRADGNIIEDEVDEQTIFTYVDVAEQYGFDLITAMALTFIAIGVASMLIGVFMPGKGGARQPPIGHRRNN